MVEGEGVRQAPRPGGLRGCGGCGCSSAPTRSLATPPAQPDVQGDQEAGRHRPGRRSSSRSPTALRRLVAATRWRVPGPVAGPHHSDPLAHDHPRLPVQDQADHGQAGPGPLDKLTAQHLDRTYREWLDEGLDPSTVHHLHRVMSAALRQAVKWGLVPPRHRPGQPPAPTAAAATDPDARTSYRT